MGLVHSLFFLAATGNYHVSIAHIPGVQNCIADHLLRLSLQAFRQLVPAADPHPTPISIPVLQTATLRRTCTTSSSSASHRPPDAPTRLVSTALSSSVLPTTSAHSPPQPSLFGYFCAHLSSSVQHSTIKLYLSALRLYHIEHGYSDSTADTLLQYVVKGIKRSQTNTPRPRLPITIQQLRDLKTSLHNSTAVTVHNKRMLCMGSILRGILRLPHKQ